MENQLWLDVLSRFTHVSTAIALMGGSIFILWVLIPSSTQLLDAEHQKLQEAVSSRWKRFIHLGILLFIASGFYNYFRAMPNHKGDGLYHALVGVKMILALGVFFIASALVGRSKGLAFVREKRVFWLRLLVTVAFVIVGISSFVKVRGPGPVKASAQVSEPQTK